MTPLYVYQERSRGFIIYIAATVEWTYVNLTHLCENYVF